jgi:hypothetical protein
MIAQQMVLCKYKDPYKFSSRCDPVTFKLELVNRGQLLMTVPSALPREHYRLVVKASDKVGFTQDVLDFGCGVAITLTEPPF